jgi:hypothetical protein
VVEKYVTHEPQRGERFFRPCRGSHVRGHNTTAFSRG